MSTENNKEFTEIKKHIQILNIAGMTAIFALTIAGFMVISELTGFDDPKYTGNEATASAYQATADIVPVDADQSIINQGVEQESNPVAAPSETKPEVSAPQEPARKDQEDKPIAEVRTIKMDEDIETFEANCNNGAIVFNWTTSGSARYAYEIEKSDDQVNYEVFTRAPQPEKHDGKNFYNVEENIAPNDQAFYRLRKVVGKGRFEYSGDVQVSCAGSAEASTTVDVFPNGYGSFRIIINAPAQGRYQVTLSDVNEKQLAVQEYDAQQGANEFTLVSDSITRGNYVLRVSNGKMMKEKRVVLK